MLSLVNNENSIIFYYSKKVNQKAISSRRGGSFITNLHVDVIQSVRAEKLWKGHVCVLHTLLAVVNKQKMPNNDGQKQSPKRQRSLNQTNWTN